MPDRITIAARSGLEAQHAHNDVFPGDPVSTLASEAAWNALRETHARLAAQMTTAFTAGDGLAVRLSIRTMRLATDQPAPDGHGWQTFHLSDWSPL